MEKNRISYGDDDLLKRSDYTPDKATVSISIRVPGDVLQAYKSLSETDGRGYQTLIVETLREAAMGNGGPVYGLVLKQLLSRLDKVEHDIEEFGLKKTVKHNKRHSRSR